MVNEKRERNLENSGLNRLAKLIRGITVPPILIASVLVLLYFTADGIFSDGYTLFFASLFLAIIPSLSYPIAAIVPSLRKKGRAAARSLSFVTSGVGYTLGAIYSVVFDVSRGLKVIMFTYFFSVLFLTFFNKIVKIRASGHGCGATGPIILPVYFIGWQAFLPCAAVLMLVYASSLSLKRHTVRELLLGSLVAFVSFAICLIII